MLGITEDEMRGPPRKRKRRGITWNEEEEIINPEDVDPSVGRFRNLVHTTVIPSRVRKKILLIVLMKLKSKGI